MVAQLNFTTVATIPETTTDDKYPFENFVPTLTQCYFIVFAGFLLAKTEVLSASDVRGVSAFASYIAMPAIICVSLADAELSDLRWELLVGIAVGKAIVFIAVSTTAISIMRPPRKAEAGIYAMFCVQCNDLPVGNPLMSALYRYVRPHMMKYLFFLPAITIVIFSPVLYLMSECHPSKTLRFTGKQRVAKTEEYVLSRRFCSRFLQFLKEKIAQSPVVIATVLGIFLNFIFKAQVPPALHHPIHVLAATIPGIALCILGFSFSGKERFLISSNIVLSIALVMVKMIFTPLVLHFVVKSMSNDLGSSNDLSDFALLYGIISPAAVIFQTAHERRMQIGAMAAALILSSLTCFPLSYVIARFTILRYLKLNDYIPTLRSMLFYTACISVVCCIYTLCSFVRDRHWKKKQHLCVTFFLFCQILVGCGMIAWHSSRDNNTYVAAFILIGGELAADVWTAVVLTSLMLRKKYPSLLKKNFFILVAVHFGCVVLITTCLFFFTANYKVRSIVMFGAPNNDVDRLQLIVTTVVLAFSLIPTCSGIAQYYRRKNKDEGSVYRNGTFDNVAKCGVYNISFVCDDLSTCQKNSTGDFSKSPSLFVENQMSSYYRDALRREDYQFFGPVWTSRIFSLLTLICLIMMVRLSSKFIKLIDYPEGSVIIPLEFLQATLFTGQGVITYLTFGIDVRTLTISMRKWFRTMRLGPDKKIQPNNEDQEFLLRLRMEFKECYYSECFNSLAKEKIWKDRHYSDSFWGHQMVDWLVARDVASDRGKAEAYGQNLLLANVIRHVGGTYNFYDAPYLYHFVK